MRAVHLGIGAALVAGTIAIYGQVRGHEFINLDDHSYVVDNVRVRRGLDIDNLRWALTTTVAANWHPLTVLSHMLDCELFGVDAGRHHLVNLAWHLANTLLLYAALARMSGRHWPSALVAALFAWHPLHVESVAWVSERKDALSTFFWFLTLLLYGEYVRSGRRWWFAAASLGLTLGLLAKSMLVTLPFVLLVLDYWPMGRLPIGSWRDPVVRRLWVRRVIEKVPMFVLVALFCLVTVRTQKSSGAVATVVEVPIVARVYNIIETYSVYAGKTAWPSGLAIPYTFFGRSASLGQFLVAVTGLGLVSWWVYYSRCESPYLLAGWLWYLGTLVPVVGIIQVGEQSRADRYTYVPIVGLFLMVAFAADEVVRRWRRLCWPVWTLAGLWLAALAVLAHGQAALWQSAVPLFRHSAQVTSRNYMAYYMLGNAYFNLGRYHEAIAAYDASNSAVENFRAHVNKGRAQFLLMQFEPALNDFARAVAVARSPLDSVEARGFRARALVNLGRFTEAKREYENALAINPQSDSLQAGLAWADLHLGQPDRALERYRHAHFQNPYWPIVAHDLIFLLASHPDPRARDGVPALAIAEQTASYNTTGEVLDALAAAQAEVGQFDSAIETAERAHRKINDGAQSPFFDRYADEMSDRLDLFRLHRPFRDTGSRLY